MIVSAQVEREIAEDHSYRRFSLRGRQECRSWSPKGQSWQSGPFTGMVSSDESSRRERTEE